MTEAYFPEMEPDDMAMLEALAEAGGSLPARRLTWVSAQSKRRVRHHRLASFEAGSWYISGFGSDLLASREIAAPMRPCPGPFGGPGSGPAR